MDSSQFNCENVLYNYTQIQSGRTRLEKETANKFIVQFMASPQAWIVAIELLNSGTSYQHHFIGAQALY